MPTSTQVCKLADSHQRTPADTGQETGHETMLPSSGKVGAILSIQAFGTESIELER